MPITDSLAEQLRNEGAVAFGITRAQPVEEKEWRYFEAWLEKGYDGGMSYMRNYPDIRRDPRLLLDGARSLISIAYNFRQPNPVEGVATYALGEDYHVVLRRRLKRVVKNLRELYGGEWRICIDSAPILERYWAGKCGVGYRSRAHGNIVVPGAGSMVFLAELLTTLEIKPVATNFLTAGLAASVQYHDENEKVVCPTGALRNDGTLDASRCINYLTIEYTGPYTSFQKKIIGDRLFGCDQCQLSCSYNQMASPGVIPEFKPLPYLREFLLGKDCAFPVDKSPVKRKFSRRK